MKYGKGNHMKAPTIFMTACGATQTAAEVYFPIPDLKLEKTKPLIDDPLPSSSIKQKGFISIKTGYALLVGINNYRSISGLNGCVNDVIDVRSKLLSFGWDPKRIMVLVDEQATKNGILSGIQWLVSHCNDNDSIWFQLSSHGSWTLTNNGQGWECCICCQDCNQDDWDNSIIKRTEFVTALERPSGNLLVKLDACFSGGMTPYYPAQKKLPPEVYKILYESIPEGRFPPNLRAYPGPEWLTIKSACSKLGFSKDLFLFKVQNGDILSRRIIDGPTHYSV
jgi:hypothetical protein